MSSNRFQSMLLAAAVAAALGAAPLAAHAMEPAHEHAAHGQLALDDGKKWPTDAALRAGMSHIRKLVEPRLAAVHAGQLGAGQYEALARKVEAEVGYIVANCKLEPRADAMLHLVIADIGAGVDAMAGKSAALKRAQGAVAVAAALDAYGRYFNHPGWTRIKALNGGTQ